MSSSGERRTSLKCLRRDAVIVSFFLIKVKAVNDRPYINGSLLRPAITLVAKEGYDIELTTSEFANAFYRDKETTQLGLATIGHSQNNIGTSYSYIKEFVI